MKHINGLMESLNRYLPINNARKQCFIHMLLGMLSTRSVNLHEIALAFHSDAQVSSRYRRLQRFFSKYNLDLTLISRWMFKLFFSDDKKFYIIIDRTNWYWGKQKINVFMLSIAYEGLAVPVIWHMLEKAGSSNFKEQRKLLNAFKNQFGMSRVEGVLADREFANSELFGWFNKYKIPFYIRIKECANVCIMGKKLWKAKKIFKELPSKSKKNYHMRVEIFGQKVFLAGSRSERGELMIVATNRTPRNAISIYLRRWEIESLFQCLKGRGFKFEETHMSKPERISKLIALLAIGFAWSHKVGEWQADIKPIMEKTFKGNSRPQYSFFRYGLDHLRNLIFQGKQQTKKWLECLRFLFESPFQEVIP